MKKALITAFLCLTCVGCVFEVGTDEHVSYGPVTDPVDDSPGEGSPGTGSGIDEGCGSRVLVNVLPDGREVLVTVPNECEPHDLDQKERTGSVTDPWDINSPVLDEQWKGG